VANHARDARGAFYSPQENLAFRVSETRICLGRRSNMFGKPLWKPAWGPDMSGPGLSCWWIGLGETCPACGSDMSSQPLWKPAWGPDMSSLGHVRAGGWTCPGNASEIWPRSRICLINSEKGWEAGHVWHGGRTCPARVSGIRLEAGHIWWPKPDSLICKTRYSGFNRNEN
jgi:hypothetical protein